MSQFLKTPDQYMCHPQQMLLNSPGGIKECFFFICQSDHNAPVSVQGMSRWDPGMFTWKWKSLVCLANWTYSMERSQYHSHWRVTDISLTVLLLIESQVERWWKGGSYPPFHSAWGCLKEDIERIKRGWGRGGGESFFPGQGLFYNKKEKQLPGKTGLFSSWII